MRLIALAVATLLSVGSAKAHVVFDEAAVSAGQMSTVHLRVTHGCEGSPTRSITVTLPERLLRVTPRVVPGWRTSLTTRQLERPLELHGFTTTEAVGSITWSGGNLPDGMYETFEFRFQAPNTPGDTLRFPVSQTCRKGSTKWDGIPAPGQAAFDLPTPAPFIAVTPVR